MGKYSDAFLAPPKQKDPGQKVKYSDSLLLGDVGPQDQWVGDKPLGSVMTKELFKDQKDSAGFSTHLIAGFADDPQTKLRVYAATRFPEMPEEERLKRYGVHKGEVVYMGDDGGLYRETADTWVQKIKRFSAETGAHAPAIVMSIIGSLGGPGTAMLGAMGGEGIRKTVAGTALKEPQTTAGNIMSMGKEGALAGVGDVGGRVISRGINKLGSMRGGKLASHAGAQRGSIDPVGVGKMEAQGKSFGVDLYAPQTTGSKRLSDKFGLLGDLESSSGIIQAARTKQVEQVDNAVYKVLEEISPGLGKETVSKTGERLVGASKKALQVPINVRKAKAGPIYKKAFKTSPDVDVKPVADWINSQLKTAKGGVRQNLLKARRIIQEPDVPKNVLDEAGNIIGRNYDTSLKGLHDAKIAIDDEIAKAVKARTGNVGTNYQKIKGMLLKQMDEASPGYARARKVYGDLSEEVTKQSRKTILGDVAKLEGDKVVNATRKLLASPEVKRAPEIVRKVRNAIMKQDPKVWDRSIATHLQELFESTKQSATGGITNIGGHFYKKVWGDLSQRKVLKAAMSPASYNNLKRFMQVLQRTGMILGKESATASRQVMLEEMQGKTLGRFIRAATRPLYTKERLLGDKLLESVLSKNAVELANAMVSKSASKQLQRMWQLSPTSQKLLPALTNFLGMVSTGAYGSSRKRSKKKDQLPIVMRPLSGAK